MSAGGECHVPARPKATTNYRETERCGSLRLESNDIITQNCRGARDAQRLVIMFVATAFLGPTAGGDADVRMRVEQIYEPVAPGPRLRDQEEELFRRRRGGGVQDEP